MPAPTQKPIIPWKRFWCRFGDAIHIGDEHQGQGFLTDPDRDFTRFYNPHLFTFEDLVREKCLILCGDPGTGKSTALQQARPILENVLGADAKLIWLEFRDVPNESVFARRTFESDAWKQWKNSSGKLALVVDGVDEGLVKIPGFVSYLAGELRNAPIDRLQIVLVCRSAEWPVSEPMRRAKNFCDWQMLSHEKACGYAGDITTLGRASGESRGRRPRLKPSLPWPHIVKHASSAMQMISWKLSWNRLADSKFNSRKAHYPEVKICGIGRERIRGGVIFATATRHPCQTTLPAGCVTTWTNAELLLAAKCNRAWDNAPTSTLRPCRAETPRHLYKM